MIVAMWELPPAAWAAITGVVATVAGILGSRKKDSADAATRLTDASLSLVNELQEELRAMRTRLETIEREIRDCERRYEDLLREVHRNGGTGR